MKEILLTQGKIALVDDDDYEYLSQFKWNANKHRSTYYARRIDYSTGKTLPLKMHRVIMGVTDNSVQVDHKDNNGLNNQKGNLRIATNSQNQANRPKRSYSKSQYKGVTLDTWNKNKWRAQIKKDGKVKGLGSFYFEIDAAKAYDAAAKTVHGEFANLNFK